MELEKVLEDFKKEIIGVSVNSIKYGDGKIVDVESIEQAGCKYYFKLVVNFGAETKMFASHLANITYDDKGNEVLEKYNTVLEELNKIEAERIAEEKRLRDEQLQKEKEEAALLKKQMKLEQSRNNALNKLRALNSKSGYKSINDNYYSLVGWMAKHCINVRAALPDWMEDYFVSVFGDVERYVVDGNKKTSGGFDYQWGLGMKVSFNEEVPEGLLKYATSKNKKIIDNVAFVWDLVQSYGFTFGKVQNIENILKEIPDNQVANFKLGYDA